MASNLFGGSALRRYWKCRLKLANGIIQPTTFSRSLPFNRRIYPLITRKIHSGSYFSTTKRLSLPKDKYRPLKFPDCGTNKGLSYLILSYLRTHVTSSWPRIPPPPIPSHRTGLSDGLVPLSHCNNMKTSVCECVCWRSTSTLRSRHNISIFHLLSDVVLI